MSNQFSSIGYQIEASDPNAHIFTVTITIPEHQNDQLNLTLPAWLPGSYMIRDFAKNIVTFSAIDNSGNAIAFNKTDKQTWQLASQGQQVIVTYQVYAFDLSVRTAYLDNQRGFFNGSSTFLQVSEFANAPCTLEIIACKNNPNWRVATGLPRAKSTQRYQFGQYIADNYHHLIDCPVELGDFDVFEFSVANIPHFMVFAGKHFADQERLIKDVSKLCQHHIDLFSEAPFEEYWFITNLLGNGFGGLEHKNSTVLVASRFDLPNPNTPDVVSENYQTFLSLCSHEYFHAWNVCRIKPAEFVPYDLSKESHTQQLWAYEGITSYYDDFSLYRTGIISFERYLKQLSKTMTRVYRGKGEHKQSLLESSFDSWTKFYQQGPDAVNNIVSYYTKGSLLALWIDLTIRDLSKGQSSLDNVMQLLWQKFGKTGIGTQNQDFIDIINNLINGDVSEKINAMLSQAKPIQLQELLVNVGVEFSQKPYAKLNSITANSNGHDRLYLGMLYKEHPLGLQITVIEQGSPAESAGLSVNDVVIAIDGLKITAQTLQQIIDHSNAGTSLSCHYFRDDGLNECCLQLVTDPKLAIGLAITNADKNSLWQTVIN